LFEARQIQYTNIVKNLELIQRKFNIVFVLLVVILLPGCLGVTPEVATQENTGSSRADGLNSGEDPDNPYPVISQIDENLDVQIAYIGNQKEQSSGEPRTYLWIGQGFISDGKIDEGRTSCAANRIKLLSWLSCDKKYDYSELKLQSQGSALTDTYAGEAYVMEENFRTEKLDLKSTKDFDIIFLENTKQSAKLASGGKLFDIFILKSMQDELDVPNATRGSIKAYDEAGKEVSVGITIRQILEDCGQPGINLLAPTSYGAIQEGQAQSNLDAANTSQYFTIAPKTVSIESLVGKRSELKTLNSLKKDLVDKILDDKSLIKNQWVLSGKVDSADPHGSFTEKQQIDLGNLVDGFNSVGQGAKYTGSTLSYSEGKTSYIILKTTKGNYLYHTQSSTLANIVPNSAANSGDASGVGPQVSNFGVEDQTNKITSDPWCGFTPESKPAIYLYPTTTTRISVKVKPQIGWMTVSDPFYGNGWNVEATPDGFINTNGRTYRHLFYEAMLPTPSMTQQFDLLDGSKLHEDIKALGKKLSLSDREATEMADYWATKLPKKNYYQVGLMTGSEVDRIEPMKVDPKPEKTYRIRLIFNCLDNSIETPSPLPALNFTRSGYYLVEWGGFVLN